MQVTSMSPWCKKAQGRAGLVITFIVTSNNPTPESMEIVIAG
jgi:hypothetical protein